MYIVSGATGQTGSAVAKTLLEKDLPVRVIVRSEEKGKPWKNWGAEVAVADVQDAESLTKALAGGKALYLMNPPNEQSENMFVETEKVIKAFQTAIKNSSFEKLVVLSSIGAHLPSGTGPIVTNHLLEQAFGNSDIPTTFVRAAYFMENWNSVLETVKSEGILPSFLQPLDKKIPQVATADIGRVAAEAMLENSEDVQIKGLAGLPYSPNDVAAAFSKVLGKEVKAIAIPENQWLEILQTFASRRNAEAYYEMMQWVNSGFITFETGNQVEGTVTIEDYANRVLK
ncbi:MAG: NmrA family NAD(P)-binding protein [Acidobacteriota bacterium]|nr:NmrA family NAD(P)-binding protein [Acidobacteriota bacterium]